MTFKGTLVMFMNAGKEKILFTIQIYMYIITVPIRYLSISSHLSTMLLGDPEVTANIYCKSRNLSNTNTQNYGTDLR